MKNRKVYLVCRYIISIAIALFVFFAGFYAARHINGSIIYRLYPAPKQDGGAIFEKKEASYPFSFVVLGDTASSFGPRRFFMIDQIIKEDPAFVLHTGDMCQFGEGLPWMSFDQGEGSILEAGIPIYPVLGNTDYNRYSGKALFPDKMRRPYFKRFPYLNNKLWYHFIYGNSVFLMLDTNTDYIPGSYQYEWLVERLKNSKSKFMFVVFHHYPYSDSGNGKTVSLSKLFESCGGQNGMSKPDIVFNGHKHVYERFRKEGVNYIVSGGGAGAGDLSGISGFDFNKFYIDGAAMNHFCKVVVNENEISVYVVALEDLSYDKKARRWEPRWKRYHAFSIRKDRDWHSGTISALAIDPRGEFIVSSGRGKDGQIKIWGAKRGDLVRTLEGHTDDVDALAISADGKYIVSGSDDSTVKIWDMSSGAMIMNIKANGAAIDRVALDKHGRHIVGGCSDGMVRVWDFRSGALLHTLSGHDTKIREGKVEGVALDPSDRYVVSGGDDTTVRKWDLDSGEPVFTLNGHKKAADSVAVDPFGKFIVSGSTDKTVRIWDFQSGKELRVLTGYNDDIDAIAISPSGNTLVTGSDDGTIKIWNMNSGELMRDIKKHEGKVEAVAIDPSGSFFVSAGEDRTIRVWDMVSGDLLLSFGQYTAGEPVFSERERLLDN